VKLSVLRCHGPCKERTPRATSARSLRATVSLSDILMIIRELGEAAIKILGVYYAASAVIGLASMLSVLALPQIEGFSATAGQLAAMNLIGVLGWAVVAGVCLLRAHILAGLLFSDERVPVSNVSRRDCLFVGISLIGFVWVVSGVPEIMKMLGKAIWHAEGSRQPMLGEMMRQSSEALVAAMLSILVGVAVVILARRLATRLDAGG
jgi:hypothetical protein